MRFRSVHLEAFALHDNAQYVRFQARCCGRNNYDVLKASKG